MPRLWLHSWVLHTLQWHEFGHLWFGQYCLILHFDCCWIQCNLASEDKDKCPIGSRQWWGWLKWSWIPHCGKIPIFVQIFKALNSSFESYYCFVEEIYFEMSLIFELLGKYFSCYTKPVNWNLFEKNKSNFFYNI